MFSVPTQLLDYLTDRKVTTLIWAVSALCLLTTLNAFEYKVPPKISKVLFSGEAMPIKHLNLWRSAYPEAMFVNLYGPTEITCNCTYYIIDRQFHPGEVLPMGRAFPNERVFLLDESDSLISEPQRIGELCVSGTALALGYYNNTEQTARAFVQNPLNSHYMETIYRTGDLAYYNENEELCFASRKDFQIKHMGQRIELGEIESCSDRIPEIKRACCIYRSETQKIVLFYEGNCTKETIVRFLRNELPVFMLPHLFYQLETMPINKNGKIDRDQLKSLLERG
jgi:non-ribosomal peptide synthetase component F